MFKKHSCTSVWSCRNHQPFLTQNTTLKGIYESEALIYLKNFLGVNDKNFSQWLDHVINDKIYRLKIHKILKSKAIQPQNPNWDVLETNLKGDLII